jgi:hypothetical protein
LLDVRSPSGEWSARENLVHLARHAKIFLDRLERVFRGDTPDLGTYRAEKDPEWPAWSELPVTTILERLQEVRGRLIAWARGLTDDQTHCTALHPTFGEMSVPQWEYSHAANAVVTFIGLCALALSIVTARR